MNSACLHQWFRGLAAVAVLLAWCPGAGMRAQAALPADAAAAWTEVEKAHAALRPPASWQRQAPKPGEIVGFQKLIRTTALSYAGKAKEFIQRFPTSENAGDARIALAYILNHAVAAGDSASEQELAKFADATLADLSIPERDRVGVFLMAGNMAVFKEAGMRYFAEGADKFAGDFERNDRVQMHEAMKLFPKSEFVFRFVIGTAQRLKGEERKQLLAEVMEAKDAPANMKTLAEHLLKGTKPYALGKPVEMKFTALDGTELDLAKLKGNVVLIYFWSMQSIDCLDEVPDLKEVYGKLHDKGLEIVGVNLDEKKTALWQFLKAKEVPWPQHFDGKGWANEYAVRYGVMEVPTMWLVDRNGNLRISNVRGNLDKVVELFLAMPAKSEP